MPDRVVEISDETVEFEAVVIRCLGREFRIDGPVPIELMTAIGDEESIAERVSALFGLEAEEFAGMDVRVLSVIANTAIGELLKQVQGKVANPMVPSGTSSPKS